MKQNITAPAKIAPIRATFLFSVALSLATLLAASAGHLQAAPFQTNSPLNIARGYHTATLLQNGKLLVAGGYNGSAIAISELYDPVTGRWTTNGAMAVARFQHTATMLPNGKVLVAGGVNSATNAVASAELFDPVSGTWSTTGSMSTARYFHTANLLTNGKVLVTGGEISNSVATNSAEIYDPVAGTWSTTDPMFMPLSQDTATLLADGTVLVASGNSFGFTSLVAIYNPATGHWSSTGSVNDSHTSGVATRLPNGQVLLAGSSASGQSKVAELYNPATQTWKLTGSMNAGHFSCSQTLLPNGKVIVVSGYDNFLSGHLTNAVEIYDPVATNWTVAGQLNAARAYHTTTLMPGGELIVVGGYNGSTYLSSVESLPITNQSWAMSGTLNSARTTQTATLLASGKVLVAGGINGSVALFGSELFDPASGTWALSGQLNFRRDLHTATLLPNGKVLAAGGYDGSTNLYATAEVYDPSSQIWTSVNSMSTNRVNHTATLLNNGKVLMVGGITIESGDLTAIYTAELFDPASGTWTSTGSLNFDLGRYYHTATLLTNGQVLVAGGTDADSSPMSNANLYDPVAGTWSTTGSMTTTRGQPSAVLLPSGKVLVAGNGLSTELYDPNSSNWTATGSMNAGQFSTLTVMPDGRVLAAGEVTEIYDPSTGIWMTNAAPVTPRYSQTTTLLTNGMLLMAAGNEFAANSTLTNSELYNPALGFSNSWQPQFTGLAAQVVQGIPLTFNGTGFRGVSEGSGGNSTADSPADFPIIQLRNLGNSQMLDLLTTNWSSNSFACTIPTNFPPGYAMITIFVNGIPSPSSIVDVLQTFPAAAPGFRVQLASLDASGAHLSLTNLPGTHFTLHTTTNVGTPYTNWTVVGSFTEVSPGMFQIVDGGATNISTRFYRATSP